MRNATFEMRTDKTLKIITHCNLKKKKCMSILRHAAKPLSGGSSQGLILQLKNRLNIFSKLAVMAEDEFLKHHIKVCAQLLENICNSKQLR